MLRLQKLVKTYGGEPVLDIPSFEIEPGIYWLSGRNGSGKSTLMRILGGLSPFMGDIVLSGISLKKHHVKYRRLISHAEAEPAYPSFISGRELVKFYKQVRGGNAVADARLVEFAGLSDMLDKPTGTYSSGMLKRLSLILAFMGQTRFVLLDEPLATLDSETAAHLPGLIQEFNQRYEVSVIFSSHQPMISELNMPVKQIHVANRKLTVHP